MNKAPRKTQAERLAELREAFQAGVDRIVAYIAFRAEREPNSIWANGPFIHNALISSIWVPEQYKMDREAHMALIRTIPPAELSTFHLGNHQTIADLLQATAVPSLDLEVIDSYCLSDSEMAETTYIIRSGSDVLFLEGSVVIKDGVSRLRDEAHGLRDQADHLDAMAAKVEAIVQPKGEDQ